MRDPAEDIAFFDECALFDASIDESARLRERKVHDGVRSLDVAEDVVLLIETAWSRRERSVVEVQFPIDATGGIGDDRDCIGVLVGDKVRGDR